MAATETPTASKRERRRKEFHSQAKQTALVYRKAIELHRSVMSSPLDRNDDAAGLALNVALRALEHLATLTAKMHAV